MRARTVNDEDGFSLVELLITIVIVSVAFVALVGGLMTTIVVSRHQRQQATADAVARSAAEWIKDPVANPFHACATTGSYTFSGLAVASGYSVSITNVQNWNPAPNPIPASYSPQFQASGAGCTNNGLQLITLTAQSTDSQATEVVQVLKRDVS